MFLRSKTGTATLVQFILGTALSFLSGIGSIIAGCRHGGVDCVTNSFVSLLVVIMLVGGYGILLALGYVAQEKRDPRLALALMACESFAGLIFLFDTKQSPDLFSKLTNLLSFGIVVWVLFIAFRQFRAGSGRMVHIPERHSSRKP